MAGGFVAGRSAGVATAVAAIAARVVAGRTVGFLGGAGAAVAVLVFGSRLFRARRADRAGVQFGVGHIVYRHKIRFGAPLDHHLDQPLNLFQFFGFIVAHQ